MLGCQMSSSKVITRAGGERLPIVIVEMLFGLMLLLVGSYNIAAWFAGDFHLLFFIASIVFGLVAGLVIVIKSLSIMYRYFYD